MPNKIVLLTNANGNKIKAIDNTSDQNIIITKTKAKYIYQKMILAPKVDSIWSWGTLAITCLITVITTNPQDVFNIANSGIFLKHSFIFGTITSTILFGRSIIKYCTTKNQYSEEAFISMLVDDEYASGTKNKKGCNV